MGTTSSLKVASKVVMTNSKSIPCICLLLIVAASATNSSNASASASPASASASPASASASPASASASASPTPTPAGGNTTGNSTSPSPPAPSTSGTTVKQKMTFTALTSTTYAGDTKGNIECAYTNMIELGDATTPPTWCTMTTTSPFRTYKNGITISSSATRRTLTVEFTLKVDSSIRTATTLETTVASNGNAANFNAKLAAVNTDTALNITSPGVSQVLPGATFTPYGSGASNLMPSMLGLVSALFTAF